MEKTIPFKNISICDDLDQFTGNHSLAGGTIIAIMCRQGRLRIEYAEQSYEMLPNDLLLCMPEFLSGNYLYSPDFRCLLFSVPQDNLSDTLYSCLREEANWYDKLQYIRQHPIIHLTKQQVQIYASYEQLILLLIQRSGIYMHKISDALAQAITLEILRIIDENIRQTDRVPFLSTWVGATGVNASRVNQLFYQFIRLLEANHSSRREVNWYANEMAISPKYLTYICKQVTAKTPTEIINAIAIREIKQVLLTTNDTVKEIAYAMNYSNASSFCKYFRIQTGMSPQAFRQQHRS